MSLNFVYVYSLGMRKTVIVVAELKEKQDEKTNTSKNTEESEYMC